MRVEYRVSYITVTDDFSIQSWDLKSLSVLRIDETEIDRRRRLELDFDKLVSNIWESAIVLISHVSQCLTHKTV